MHSHTSCDCSDHEHHHHHHSMPSSRVLLISLRKAQLFIGKPYLNKTHLSYLFEIDDPNSIVLLDPDAEEINYDDQGNFECDVTKHYTIVTDSMHFHTSCDCSYHELHHLQITTTTTILYLAFDMKYVN